MQKVREELRSSTTASGRVLAKTYSMLVTASAGVAFQAGLYNGQFIGIVLLILQNEQKYPGAQVFHHRTDFMRRALF